MKKSRRRPLDFLIDKLTNSIENTITGEVFDTEIVRIGIADLNQIAQFDWVREIQDKCFIETSAALRLISQYFKS